MTDDRQTLAHVRAALEQGDGEPPKLTLCDARDTDHVDVLITMSTHDVVDLRRAHRDAVIIVVTSKADHSVLASLIADGADDVVDASDLGDARRFRELVQASIAVSDKSTAEGRRQGQKPPRSIVLPAGKTMRAVEQRVPRIIASAARCVHVFGEPGTGKEVVASLFTQATRGVPFVSVNCAAIPPTLLESTLFGSVRGAYTGAVSDTKGFFEAASGGWLFLDEVGCLTEVAQAALLRAIEAQEIVRVGDHRRIPIDVRVLSATNSDLRQRAAASDFRADLWQRLSEIELALPPLRERRDEIPELVDRLASDLPGGPYELTRSARRILCSLSWREGNVRQLRNCLRAMTEKKAGRILTPQSIPRRLLVGDPPSSGTAIPPASRPLRSGPQSLTVAVETGGVLDFERLTGRLFVAVLRHLGTTRGHLTLRELEPIIGLSRSTISRKLHAAVEGRLVSRAEVRRWIRIDREGKLMSSE